MSSKITTITRQPFWLNKKTMADSLGISVQAFDKWSVTPVAKIGRESFYDVRSVLDNRLQHQTGKQQPGAEEVDPLIGYKIDLERWRLTKEQADTQARKNKIGDKELVPVGFAIFVLARIAALLASYLDTIPKKVKLKHPDLEIRYMESFEREIAVTRNEAAGLAETIPELLDEYVTALDKESG
jgi:phage terminase Nu1 subunit (DNA packaging protein)